MRFLLKRRQDEPPARQPLDRRETTWVSTNRRSFDTFSVGSLVPVAFDRYARVLHPASTYDNRPVRWDEVAGWSGKTAHALAQWEWLAQPIRGRELGPRPFVLPPRAGGLPQGQLRALSELLAGHTADPEHCFIGLWDGYGSPAVWLTKGSGPGHTGPAVEAPTSPLWAEGRELRFDYRAFVVLEGSIATVSEMADRHGPFGYQLPPTLFWPADHAWFVATDPDLEFDLRRRLGRRGRSHPGRQPVRSLARLARRRREHRQRRSQPAAA